MNARWVGMVLGGLFGAVIIAGLYFPILKQRVKQTAKIQPQSEEQARRELTQSLTANPTEARVNAKLFWASNAHDGSLAPVTVELPLSNEPVLRAKQVLNTLLAGPADPELRTLPPDAVLLAFYLLPDGTGIADFSEAMASSIPSGIESEQRAVDSMTRTLAANVPQITRLKILIHGQEVETLAGHLDLTGSFVVSPRAAQAVLAPQIDPLTSSTNPFTPLTPTSTSRQTYAATPEPSTNSRNP